MLFCLIIQQYFCYIYKFFTGSDPAVFCDTVSVLTVVGDAFPGIGMGIGIDAVDAKEDQQNDTDRDQDLFPYFL